LRRLATGLGVPLALGGLALLWGVVQIIPYVPQSWSHPVWQMAAAVLGTHPAATISLNPWRSGTELMKLATYAMALWLARIFANRSERANVLLDAIIAISGVYAAYAFIMAGIGVDQFNLFYSVPTIGHGLAAPFVNRNSFACYAGLAALAAGVRLVEKGSGAVIAHRGWRTYGLTLLQYLFGRGAPYLVAAVIAASAVIATGSRAGNAAFFTAAAVLFVLSLLLSLRQARGLWAMSVAIVVAAGLIALFAINGNVLLTRFDDMAAAGLDPGLRQQEWDAALRMIHDAPLLGLGLGTYINAYPMYSDTVTRFIIDRAHNDYLELAAGWGLPAAILWWSAMLWLVGLCARGVFQRRRARAYPMLAVAASVLVGVHSAFDFPLQMPAIALLYAVILGLGVAQAFPTRNGA
ncbi:MAG: O-antigen ligase family protein, partial [Pseudomonadota bacterium]|nr:O-antigen ligase family protein [Pseudomonadota bacterium]